jgi:stage V sporulation protein SpoVS
MPVTTLADLRTAVLAGIASNPSTPIKTLLKQLRAEKSNPSDVIEDLADVATYLAQSVATITAAGLGPLNQAISILARNWATMSPAEKTSTINRFRTLMTHANSTPDLKLRYEDAKRRLFLSFEDTDPCEAIFTANKAILAAPGAKTTAEVQAAIDAIRAIEHLLPPATP